MCVRFGKQITYTPKQTSEYEKLVKASEDLLDDLPF